MNLNSLTAISPIDGRYHNKTKELQKFFSEFGLIRYRVLVEIQYFISLSKLKIKGLEDFPQNRFSDLEKIYLDFNEEDARWIKESEKVTNHDVKAVEYFLKEKMSQLGLEKYLEFIHFGLTSQDINNTSVPLSLKEGLGEVYFPLLNQLISKLKALQNDWMDVPMLAKTHGQPASPTRLGKEIQVFSERLLIQLEQLQKID
jgi:adenylosuccinate lyase